MKSKTRAEKGADGEDTASQYLRFLGYEILHRNKRLSRYEIDIICRDQECLVFVEVKNSPAGSLGHPATWIDKRKQEKLRAAAEIYIKENQITGTDIRFDAVTIFKGQIEHFKNAF
jgi:putative endonuclease